MNRYDICEDTKAMLLLCTNLGGELENAQPYRGREWDGLHTRMAEAGLTSPSQLVGMPENKIREIPGLSGNEASRIVALLRRGGQMAIELEKHLSRGIRVATLMEPDYPERYKLRLKGDAPPVIFYAGERELLNIGGLAVVGSRNIDEPGTRFTERICELCASENIAVISGGARGTDIISMRSAINSGGISIGVLADSLTRTIVRSDARPYLMNGHLLLITVFHPDTGFSVGNAMHRNKFIYSLSDYALVVSSDYGKGGTWAGATEALKKKYCPVYVRSSDNALRGNRELEKLGAVAFPEEYNAGLLDILTPAAANDKGDSPQVLTLVFPQCQEKEKRIQTPSQAETHKTDDKDNDEFFAVIRSVLIAFLTTGKKQEDVVSTFQLPKRQGEIWLKRLVEEGFINKNKKTKILISSGIGLETAHVTSDYNGLVSALSPFLINYLDSPRSKKDISAYFKITPALAENLLVELIRKGLVRKTGKSNFVSFKNELDFGMQSGMQ